MITTISNNNKVIKHVQFQPSNSYNITNLLITEKKKGKLNKISCLSMFACTLITFIKSVAL